MPPSRAVCALAALCLVIMIPITTSYYYYYSPSRALTPTRLLNQPGSRFGYVNNVPFDPADSFTNYNWEPAEEETDSSRSSDGVPNYSHHDNVNHQLQPPISRGTERNAPTTRIPIRPYDYNAVYMDGNEDSFDGISNNRWNKPAMDLIPPHVSLTGPDRPDDRSLMPNSRERSNIPFGRRLGFDYLPSYLDTPSMERVNSERYIDVNFVNIITRRSLFQPPHFPGLQ